VDRLPPHDDRREHQMDEDDEYVETQYTDAARDAYLRRADELVAALRAHVDVTLSRRGIEREMPRYFESVAALESAATAFNDAEFNWGGTTPLPLLTPDYEEDEEDEQEPASGGIVSLLGRWDFRVTDEAALIQAGRSAHLHSWADRDREDAEFVVNSITRAASEVFDTGGPEALENTDGMEPVRAAFNFILHDGGDDEEFDEDPFAIARDA
jgi:hypothetical protein